MNSTQAIQAAVEFIQSAMENDNLENLEFKHYDENDQTHMQEVITLLQRLPQASGSNYGTLWSIEDLRSLRPAWSDEKLTDWMESKASDISDRQCEDGWETIGYLLEDGETLADIWDSL